MSRCSHPDCRATAEAGSGEEALKLCRDSPPDLVLSDWMMPGMSGLEFCRLFRQMPRERYGYFILLTSKSEKESVARGLDCGADDFLTKPFNTTELRARLTAGVRVLEMEQELHAKSTRLAAALEELQSLYDTIDRDLVQARKIQESLVPDRVCRIGQTQVSMLLKPSGHVGGDLVGVFHPGQNRIGFYSIDVSGHGITSALMTARLASYLSGRFLEQNIALERRLDRFYSLRPVQEVARILNDRLNADAGIDQYFTMVYGICDLKTGLLSLVQAGHPHPLLQRQDGQVLPIGQSGLPIGLIDHASWDAVEVQLTPGDRVLLHSDGFSECENPDGLMLEDAGLVALLARVSDLSGPAMLDALFEMLSQYQGHMSYADDVSAILLEYGGPE